MQAILVLRIQISSLFWFVCREWNDWWLVAKGSIQPTRQEVLSFKAKFTDIRIYNLWIWLYHELNIEPFWKLFFYSGFRKLHKTKDEKLHGSRNYCLWLFSDLVDFAWIYRKEMRSQYQQKTDNLLMFVDTACLLTLYYKDL